MKKYVSTLVLLFVLCSVLVSLPKFSIGKAESGTIIVPDDYPTIHEAVNNAIDGDSIYVRAGTYYENVVLNKTLSLLGEKKETTVIDGNATGTVVSITADNVVINGFTIQNSGDYPSSNIHILNSNGNNITDNIVRNNNDRGIYLSGSMCNTISNNYVVNTYYGILLDESTGNIISDNNVSSHTYGIYLYESSKNNFVSANNVSSSYIGVFLGPVPAGGGDMPSTNNIVSYNIVSSSDTGIMVGGSSYNSILTNNVVKYNNWGIYLQGTTNNTISGNNITDNNLGIYMDGGCNYTNFYHNNFVNNAEQVNNRAWNYSLPISWDNGYPSGGNYWSDYAGVDNYSGPFQNETGSDGIGDTTYVINTNNQDNYPLNSWILILPPSYTLMVCSSPVEVTFTVDGVSHITPWSRTYNESTSVSLVMPQTITVGEGRYYWGQWSDGVINRSRTVTLNRDVTLAAYYTGPYYELTVTSSPITGITFTINGIPKTTPYTDFLFEGSYNIVMPENHNGYIWSHWLEDEDINKTKTERTKTVALYTNFTVTAVFTPDITPSAISILAQQEPFPTWIAAAIAIIAIGGAAPLVYFRKIKKTTTKAEK